MQRKNVYTCQLCGGQTITIDIDEGVTPMLLDCRASEGFCGGMAVSACYRDTPTLEPAWEWFKPTGADYERLSPAMKDHIDRGGLDIRRVSK